MKCVKNQKKLFYTLENFKGLVQTLKSNNLDLEFPLDVVCIKIKFTERIKTFTLYSREKKI